MRVSFLKLRLLSIPMSVLMAMSAALACPQASHHSEAEDSDFVENSEQAKEPQEEAVSIIEFSQEMTRQMVESMAKNAMPEESTSELSNACEHTLGEPLNEQIHDTLQFQNRMLSDEEFKLLIEHARTAPSEEEPSHLE